MKNTQNSAKSAVSRRNVLKAIAASGAALTLPSMAASGANQCHDYAKVIKFNGLHQAGVITKEQKDASFIAFDVTTESLDELEQCFKILTDRIAYLTQAHAITPNTNDKLPPRESGILGSYLKPDALTITVALGDSLFDSRFGLSTFKPKHLVEMKSFPNDQLEQDWCGGDITLQICANSPESVIYALRDIIRHTNPYLVPVWKMDGFLPSRNIDNQSTPINLFGFKDGTGNAPSDNTQLMDDIVWVTDDDKDQPWCVGGSYQAIRLIRFNLEFWDRTPLEDQENDFGRHKVSGAPIGMKNEQDSPEFAKDPHGDRILFDSHMRRAEPRNPHRHTAELRRRSYSYSLGVSNTGALDMGLIFVCYQQNLKTGFIDTQKRLNGEPLERYVKPFGGGYYFVLPGLDNKQTYLASQLFALAKHKPLG
ncbi:iron uptake transporter deferrochelatase/peroxidase subunit [Vibrio taketomensis]|uniref:iron uptake transporter deferrochelatase/peroxidase subunit n=1 Tax=Vibrio taketomensis TaxID=2572923 RepID=UPI001389A9EC|nr:iron uptake transporter deferrochelatase/peroxidase subunit [Vibrio taketomensis]